MLNMEHVCPLATNGFGIADVEREWREFTRKPQKRGNSRQGYAKLNIRNALLQEVTRSKVGCDTHSNLVAESVTRN